MTILQLISSEGYYGVENMLVSLAQAASKAGCRSIVGVFRDSRDPHIEVAEEARRLGLPVALIPCSGRWDWAAVRQIRRLIRDYQVDVLHPHGYKADLYSFAAVWPSRAGLLATSHNWPSTLPNMRLYAAVDRFVLRFFDRVVVVSDRVAQTLRRAGVAERKLATIYNGVDIDRFYRAEPTLRREIKASETGRVVGFVGRLIREKGVLFLLHAARQIIQHHPGTIFVFVGDGPARQECECLACELRISANVIFTGVRNDMPGVYASLDMVVLPSFEEAMPMCLLEAMAAAKPVVATRVGAVPKLVLPAITGILVEPGDSTGLAREILGLLAEPELAHRLGQAGHARTAQNFSVERMAAAYIELYDEARKKPAPLGCEVSLDRNS